MLRCPTCQSPYQPIEENQQVIFHCPDHPNESITDNQNITCECRGELEVTFSTDLRIYPGAELLKTLQEFLDILENPSVEPPEDSKEWTVPPEKAPDKPEYVTINFEEGIPVGLNGEKMNGVELIRTLHKLGCKHGVGRIEHMEDRAIGLKSRETYEVPAALILIKAHKDLEKYTCTKHENSFKTIVDQRWTELAYEGLWVDP